MKRTVKLFILFLSLFFLTILVVFIFNQTLAIVNFFNAISLSAGRIVLFMLLVIYTICIAVPVYLYFKIPKPIRPPSDFDQDKIESYRKELVKRLNANQLLKGKGCIAWDDDRSIGRALGVLSDESDKVASKSAKHVFIATAICQNGRLDGLVVLAVQTRLIWRIAHIYYQRPSLREMLNLYINVLLTAFIAVELQDVDISDQLDPLLSSVLGSAAGAIPGAKLAASVLVDTGLTGGANAFLTLRIGMITKKYCGMLVQQKRGILRRSASAEAAKLLGTVISVGTKKVAVGIAKATGSKVTQPFTAVYGHARKSVKGVMTNNKRRKEYLKNME